MGFLFVVFFYWFHMCLRQSDTYLYTENKTRKKRVVMHISSIKKCKFFGLYGTSNILYSMHINNAWIYACCTHRNLMRTWFSVVSTVIAYPNASRSNQQQRQKNTHASHNACVTGWLFYHCCCYHYFVFGSFCIYNKFKFWAINYDTKKHTHTHQGNREIKIK